MTDQPTKKSQIRRSLDQVVPEHYDWLRTYDAVAQAEYQRPARTRPEIPPIRPPMSAMPANASIKVNGQRVGSAPASWSEPRHPRVDAIPSKPATPEEQREQRRARKAKQLADVQARTAARLAREAEAAERAGFVPTMSEATRKHFMKLLDKRGRY